MTNQEQSNQQSAQENVQELTEGQLEGVAGGGKFREVVEKFVSCVSCAGMKPIKFKLEPPPSPSTRQAREELQAFHDKDHPIPEEWKGHPAYKREQAKKVFNGILG